MTDEDWLLVVELDDEAHAYSLGERLRALDLGHDARRRLGRRAVVSRTPNSLFVYTHTRAGAEEAERIVRELLAADRLTADLRIVRWHPDAEAWEAADVPLPQTEAEQEAEREELEDRKRVEVAGGGWYDWAVHVTAPERAAAGELEQEMRVRRYRVERHWRFLTIFALSEDNATAIASLVLELVPDAEVAVEPIIDEPAFVLARTFL